MVMVMAMRIPGPGLSMVLCLGVVGVVVEVVAGAVVAVVVVVKMGGRDGGVLSLMSWLCGVFGGRGRGWSR